MLTRRELILTTLAWAGPDQARQQKVTDQLSLILPIMGFEPTSAKEVDELNELLRQTRTTIAVEVHRKLLRSRQARQALTGEPLFPTNLIVQGRSGPDPNEPFPLPENTDVSADS